MGQTTQGKWVREMGQTTHFIIFSLGNGSDHTFYHFLFELLRFTIRFFFKTINLSLDAFTG